MTQQNVQDFIEAQRQDWNRVAGGWEKWDRLFEEHADYLNHRLVADARLCQRQAVLDLGSGTGPKVKVETGPRACRICSRRT